MTESVETKLGVLATEIQNTNSLIKGISKSQMSMQSIQAETTKEMILVGAQVGSLHSRQDEDRDDLKNLASIVASHENLHQQHKGASKLFGFFSGICGAGAFGGAVAVIKAMII